MGEGELVSRWRLPGRQAQPKQQRRTKGRLSRPHSHTGLVSEAALKNSNSFHWPLARLYSLRVSRLLRERPLPKRWAGKQDGLKMRRLPQLWSERQRKAETTAARCVAPFPPRPGSRPVQGTREGCGNRAGSSAISGREGYD